MSLLSRHRTASIFNQVLSSDKKWILCGTPKHSKHWLSLQDTVPHCEKPPMHPHKIMRYVCWTNHQEVHYEVLPTSQAFIAALYSQESGRVQQALQ
ncbi:histone-lysine N-methyltransferase SETMAR [Nephila pilipes]|uniref:Histone-lysine N-methyltransferase SETMAR n=1 Tax=Nephila pilipes TaxID=299642 RepID=A0A8X6R3A3_NEPPI|nr:histone-lysine N-methyltransferase SETMAR [Nephila pilipes]